jgi:hypothetical protein
MPTFSLSEGAGTPTGTNRETDNVHRKRRRRLKSLGRKAIARCWSQ